MGRRTILIVEDNPDDEELTVRALRQTNAVDDIVVAHDGVEATDYLFGTGKFSGRDLDLMPQVVLLDLKLPKLNGLEVLRQVRSNGKTSLLPVVILTSSKEEQDRLNAYKSGANSYIRKPVDFVRFAEAVKQLELYWLDLNESPPKE